MELCYVNIYPSNHQMIIIICEQHFVDISCLDHCILLHREFCISLKNFTCSTVLNQLLFIDVTFNLISSSALPQVHELCSSHRPAALHSLHVQCGVQEESGKLNCCCLISRSSNCPLSQESQWLSDLLMLASWARSFPGEAQMTNTLISILAEVTEKKYITQSKQHPNHTNVHMYKYLLLTFGLRCSAKHVGAASRLYMVGKPLNTLRHTGWHHCAAVHHSAIHQCKYIHTDVHALTCVYLASGAAVVSQ